VLERDLTACESSVLFVAAFCFLGRNCHFPWGDSFYLDWNVILRRRYRLDNRGTGYRWQGTGFRTAAGLVSYYPTLLRKKPRTRMGHPGSRRFFGYGLEVEVVAVSFQAAGFAGKLLVGASAPTDSVFFVGAGHGDSGDGEGWRFFRCGVRCRFFRCSFGLIVGHAPEVARGELAGRLNGGGCVLLCRGLDRGRG